MKYDNRHRMVLVISYTHMREVGRNYVTGSEISRYLVARGIAPSETTHILQTLVKHGYLEKSGGCYMFTESGAQEYEQIK